MKRFMTVLSLALSSFSYASVEVSEIHRFAINFHGDDAKKFSNAFGIVDKTSDTFTLDVGGNMRVKASVTGSYSNGNSSYHYNASVLIEADKVTREGNVVTLPLVVQQAQKIYDALKGVKAISKEEGQIEVLTKKLEFSNFRLVCSYTPRGFISHECKIDFKKKLVSSLDGQ